MFIRGLFRVGDDGHGLQNGAQILLPGVPARQSRPFNSMPKFGNGYRSNLELVMGTGRNPPLQVESALLPANDHVRVKNYRHELAGALRTFRAAFRSRCHALVSLLFSLALARTSAKSRPTQTFSLSGTRRANGLPFFRSTNVTCW